VAHVCPCMSPAISCADVLVLHTGVLQARAPPLSGSEWVPLDVLRTCRTYVVLIVSVVAARAAEVLAAAGLGRCRAWESQCRQG
jgi:hypothetical protein